MELRMSSLVPDQAVTELTRQLGTRFAALPETARLALITAQVEGLVSHDRLKQISTDHPADLTKMLGGLVREGLLITTGTGRGTVYYLAWQRRMAATVFDSTDQAGLPPELGSIPPELGSIPPELTPQTSEVATYLSWNDVPVQLQDQLSELARPVSQAPRVQPQTLRAVVQRLCSGRYLGRHVLAHLLERNADDLLKRTLTPMVEAGLLKPAYAASRDPRQAYTAAIDNIENTAR